MKVLVACEFSGIVSAAFAAKGNDVTSCDLLPTEYSHHSNVGSFRHHQGDVLDLLQKETFDFMIGHPPCKYLSFSANRIWNKPGRAASRNEAMKFFLDLFNCQVKHCVLENPNGYPAQVFRPADQWLYPYYFGSTTIKRIALWLKNVPPLVHCSSDNLFEKKTHSSSTEAASSFNKKGNPCYHIHKFHNWKDRSRFFPEVAEAMANQWTEETLKLSA